MYCTYKFIFRRWGARGVNLRFVTAIIRYMLPVVDLSILFSDSSDLHFNDPYVPCPSVEPGMTYIAFGFNSRFEPRASQRRKCGQEWHLASTE